MANGLDYIKRCHPRLVCIKVTRLGSVLQWSVVCYLFEPFNSDFVVMCCLPTDQDGAECF